LLNSHSHSFCYGWTLSTQSQEVKTLK